MCNGSVTLSLPLINLSLPSYRMADKLNVIELWLIIECVALKGEEKVFFLASDRKQKNSEVSRVVTVRYDYFGLCTCVRTP